MLKNGTVELDSAGEVFKGHGKQITDAQRVAHVKTLLAKKDWAAWFGS